MTALGTAAAGRPAALCFRSTAALARLRPGITAGAEPRHVPVPPRRHGVAYAPPVSPVSVHSKQCAKPTRDGWHAPAKIAFRFEWVAMPERNSRSGRL